MLRPSCLATSLACCGASLLSSTVFAGVTPIGTDRVASGLNRPVFVTAPDGDFERLFIVEQRGVIKILNLDSETVNATPYLNIDALVPNISGNDERGLLGLAFHPDYLSNGVFYLNYINLSNDTVIARGTVSANPDVANTTLTTLRIIDQPFTNHNCGWIAFSPLDGYLYIGTGDGGSGGDPGNRAQDITNQPLGKLLRYDVGTDGLSFTPPASNPFFGPTTGDDEIWAYGLRNPWRNSFDRKTGDLFIADVGQNAWEEINYQRGISSGGENYGWRCREGAHPYNTAGCGGGFVEPIQEYGHTCTTGGFSITGGYVYRGCDMPLMQGTYFYADFVCQNIWSFRFNNTVTEFQERTAELTPSVDGGTVSSIASFGEDAAGEIYIVDRGGATTGEIYKIVPDTPWTPGDTNGDGVVNVTDLVNVVLGWGSDGLGTGVNADVNCDGTVNVQDLLDVILQWST